MDYNTEYNLLKGIEDIVSNLKKQHAEEIKLLNNQHKEVVQELLNQSQSTETNHREALNEAHKQVKYTRWAFIIAIIALLFSISIGILQIIIKQ